MKPSIPTVLPNSIFCAVDIFEEVYAFREKIYRRMGDREIEQIQLRDRFRFVFGQREGGLLFLLPICVFVVYIVVMFLTEKRWWPQ